MVADGKDFLQFRQRGVGMFFDMGVELGRVEFAPRSPARFGGQSVGFDRRQVAVNRAPAQFKAPPGLHFGAAGLEEPHHPFA